MTTWPIAASGGPDKAVYAYALEDVRWWEAELGRAVAYGEFGENLTTEGLDVNAAPIGERWEIGSTILEVAAPRVPCWRLGVRMDDKLFPRKFVHAGRPGAYLCIIREGELGAGDEIGVVASPNREPSIVDVSRQMTSQESQ